MEFPETLYVSDEPVYATGFSNIRHLVGSKHLETRIPLGNKPTVVAVYKLVRMETYKKIETTTIKLEKL